MEEFSSSESDQTDEEDANGVAEFVFQDYKPDMHIPGIEHPALVCESSSLAFVRVPDLKLKLKLSKRTLDNISKLQYETAALACQKMEKFLPIAQQRSGFYLGDGTGVGKGRTIATIILHNYNSGRKKALFVTSSSILETSLAKDLRMIGYISEILTLNTYSPIVPQRGVLFITYSSLCSKSKDGVTRYSQVKNWLGKGFDGVIAFDESHRAKKFSMETKKSTTTGNHVVKLQKRYPNARVIYSSATAAWEPKHLGYMQRLGLWNNREFPELDDFVKTMEKRPVEAMELLSMELKSTGFYLARQLSFKGVHYQVEVAELTQDFRELYDDCAELWCSMFRYLRNSIEEGIIPDDNYGQFWSSHQRFFATLCTSSKVEQVRRLSRGAMQLPQQQRDMEMGGFQRLLNQEVYSVVVGLQSTGEVAFRQTRITKERLGFDKPFSLARCTLLDCIYEILGIPEPNKDQSVSTLDTDCHSDSILLKMNSIVDRLPANTLDRIIRVFGGPSKVAEMTGRQVREAEVDIGDGTSTYTSEPRAGHENSKDQYFFMMGTKQVIVISDAASTGISLHSDRTYGTCNRRLHITIELPWSADKAVQQLGRTHRSNQLVPPLYVLVVSPIPAERRFTFAISERLLQMGALTHGDRRASSSKIFSEFYIQRGYSRKAIVNLLKSFCKKCKPVVDAFNTKLLLQERDKLAHMMVGAGILDWKKMKTQGSTSKKKDIQLSGFLSPQQDSAMVPNAKCYKIETFLNRLFGISLSAQEKVLEILDLTIEFYVETDKSSGEFSSPVKDLTPKPGSRISVVLKRQTNLSLHTGALQLNEIEFDSGLSWKKAVRVASMAGANNWSFFSTNSCKPRILLATRDQDDTNKYKIYRPATGLEDETQTFRSLKENRSAINPKDAKIHWKKEFQKMGQLNCCHQFTNRRCRRIRCSTGSRIQSYFILSGCLTRIWNTIMVQTVSRARIVKCMLSNGEKVIGLEVHQNDVEKLMTALEQYDQK